MGLLYYVSYVCTLAALAFVTLSLASGLLYLSELIEEHSRLAKSVGQRITYAVIISHMIFYVTEPLPLLHTFFSIACHFVYLQNFSPSWPSISLTSPSFIASCLFVVADHFSWFFYFARISAEARHSKVYRGISSHSVPSFTEIASFFGICVWLTPLFLFLSLSANDNALPLTAAEPGSPLSHQQSLSTAANHVSLIRSMFTYISFDGFLSRIRPRRRDSSAGIIAPHSPLPPASHYGTTYPPHQQVDMSQRFKLDAPPPRRSASQGSTSDGSSKSLRRTSSLLSKHD